MSKYLFVCVGSDSLNYPLSHIVMDISNPHPIHEYKFKVIQVGPLVLFLITFNYNILLHVYILPL